VVSLQKRLQKTLYIIFTVTILVNHSPSIAHAGVVSSFTTKVKSIFLGDDVSAEESAPTSQTLPLPRSVIVGEDDEDATETMDMVDKEKGVLQVTSGPMRLSTEDIDFPTTDEITLYEVKKGDTLASVAKLFNVSKNTIMWANDLKSQSIAPGDTLLILPITGIKHTIKKGDTVTSIARRYKADADDIAKYNGVVVDGKLSVGDTLIVPDGEITVSQPKPRSSSKVHTKILNSYAYSAPSGFFIRPVTNARKTQGLHGHNGIDFGATPGTPILAAASGQIIVAKNGGYNGGYGSMIVIAHDGNIQTVYAHLRAVYVTQGQTVSQGDVIGEVGNTGRSTGPHLHFEVRGAKNPF
jgi:murein DD-endopeptidase MepM/ murein hydrolase activator NlpD